jgi:small subunit ribosomal protein S6
MPEKRVYNYEGLFLISQAVAADFKGAIEHIRSILEKNGGQIIAMRKFHEGRLAYEIDKQKRGLYILTYFSMPGDAMGTVERSFNLSEQVMRYMFVRADHLSLDEMKAADDAKGLETEAKLRATQPAMAMAVNDAPVTVGDESEIEE